MRPRYAGREGRGGASQTRGRGRLVTLRPMAFPGLATPGRRLRYALLRGARGFFAVAAGFALAGVRSFAFGFAGVRALAGAFGFGALTGATGLIAGAGAVGWTAAAGVAGADGVAGPAGLAGG